MMYAMGGIWSFGNPDKTTLQDFGVKCEGED